MRKCLDELDDNERRRVTKIVIHFKPEDQEPDTDSDDLDDEDEEDEDLD
jgi:hypothetical protein